MSFQDLPALPRMLLPGAHDYADRISAASRKVMAAARWHPDIPYATESYWQKLDIYQPADTGLVGLPVFCFLHGGAWRNGCKEWMGFMAPPVTALPAILVTASYRHAPVDRFPAQLHDVCALLAWLRDNIARYGGSPDRVHLGGHSAGGHLAALATLDDAALARQGLPLDFVKSCHPQSGVFSFANLMPGIDLLADPAQAEAASPLAYVKARTPFHLSWGTDDVPGLADQGAEFAAALIAAGAVVEQQIFPGYTHWATNECGGDAAHPWTRAMLRWLAA